MRLGIMQPYFMPYLGYFSLIKHTDEFILLDTVQFIYHGWIERNRILKQTGGWMYISVPLKKHSRETMIKDILIDNSQNWKSKILSQIQHYRKAPYFWQIKSLLEELFSRDYTSITLLDQAALRLICDYLGIQRGIPVFSEMQCDIGPVNAPDEWALQICKALQADEYWNPPGGIDFFDKSKYAAAGIDMHFQEIILQEYPQKGGVFEPGLSILDAIMFNSPETVNGMLDQFSLL